MDIYKLTNIGEQLSHQPRPESNNNRWKVIAYLSKVGASSKENLVLNTGATSYDLAVLSSKNVIRKNDGVMV